jgi:hypothetical protein
MHPFSKLDVKCLGPFKILEVIRDSKLTFWLELPMQMHIHPVFHVSLLEPHWKNHFPDWVQLLPPPVELEDDMEWEVEEVLDLHIWHRKIEYLIHWQGYGLHKST